MEFGVSFFVSNVLLGLGLAMDAFSVSMANGLSEPKMKREKGFLIALIFGVFQGVMPLTGWACVHTFVSYFKAFQRFIPFIALFLLLFIGGKMIYESIKNKEDRKDEKNKTTIASLLIQGIATSIDALSVGFTISDYDLKGAALSALIIALITLVTCFLGVEIGKKFGTRLSDKAEIFGGIILILIGIEIFISGI